jgi:predicted alpha/beta hydrolase
MGFMPLSYRLLSIYFFKIFTPLSNLIVGYVAAKRFNIMEDLPKNVVNEWHDWCNVPNYFFNDFFYGKTVPKGNFQNYTFPVHVVWTTDDPISNKNSISAYWQNVKSCKSIEIQKIKPSEYGLKKIEHFGFFRRHLRDTLWQESLDKINYFINH